MTAPKAPAAAPTPEARFQAAIAELQAAGTAFLETTQDRHGLDVYVTPTSDATVKFAAGAVRHVQFS